MKYSKVLVWYIVNGGKEHPLLPRQAVVIVDTMPLINTLFPGINFFSVTGFSAVMRKCVVPALQKRFPELLTTPAEAIKEDDVVEITEFLSSDGYEWQESDKWESKFKTLLKAA